MTENNKVLDFMTFPKTFEKYKWYKPILVFIVGLIIFIVLMGILLLACWGIFGMNYLNSFMTGGYEILNTEAGQIISDLSIIILIPSLYLASKIVKDRPFSSYSSSRGGWNFKLYLKALIIPFVMLLVFQGIEILVVGSEGTNHFSILFLIITVIMVPLQCIAEEYVFRGWLMQTLGSWFKIPILAIVIQAILFAAIHGYNSLGILEVGISGFIYGFFTWKTNGIEVSSALHTANNLSIALLVMFGLASSSSTVSLNDLVLVVAFDIILFVVMYYVGKKTNWFGELEQSA